MPFSIVVILVYIPTNGVGWMSWMTALFFFFFFFLVFSRAAPAAYGGSQARGLIGAVAAGLRQSHSNTGSKLRL